MMNSAIAYLCFFAAAVVLVWVVAYVVSATWFYHKFLYHKRLIRDIKQGGELNGQ